MDGDGDGLGEEGSLGEVNSMGKVRRWEYAGTTRRVGGGPLPKGGVKYSWVLLTSWSGAVTPIIYLIY